MAPDDPRRCQYITPAGQCIKEATEGSDKCPSHGGKAKDALKAYLITCKYLGDSPNRHLAAQELKSLREEIALTRSMIETRMNMIESEAEFVASMPVFQSYMNTIATLVTACHQMEVKLGVLLSKSALLSLAQKMVEVISTNLQGIPGKDEIVEKVANEIVTLVLAQENQ
jgi:hypothetical protein